MTNQEFKTPDADRDRLRGMVAAIDRHMLSLSELTETGRTTTVENRTAMDRLLGRWSELVTQLALGPAPEYRVCPVCRHIGMRAATRCGYCWTKLPPFVAGDSPQVTPPPPL